MASFEAREFPKTQGHCKCSPEEERRKARRVQKPSYWTYSDRFEDIKDDLVRKERHMLKEFGF